MTVTTDFCGGNARILSADEGAGLVLFEQELRDTTENWFYWAFCVRGAQGKTLTFRMKDRFVGPFGAAVSRDLLHWTWSDSASEDCTGFVYTFGADEDCVYFAHDMLYHPAQFYLFAERHGLHPAILAEDRGGTPIPYVTVGEGEDILLLTARHHACEATGNYMMEGIIDAYLASPIENMKIIAVPFADADGVVRGDQGKSRAPHDHNRDYTEGIYPGVRAVRGILGQGHVKNVFDLHSPWHVGGENNRVFLVRKFPEYEEKYSRLGKYLEEETAEDPAAMRYRTDGDIHPGERWNALPYVHNQCSTYAADFPGVDLSLSVETTYFGEPDNRVSQERLIETGRCLYRAYRAYRKEGDGT